MQQKHIDMGEAIASLRDEGVLVLGSGSSFHNMQGFNFDSKDQIDGKSQVGTIVYPLQQIAIWRLL